MPGNVLNRNGFSKGFIKFGLTGSSLNVDLLREFQGAKGRVRSKSGGLQKSLLKIV